MPPNNSPVQRRGDFKHPSTPNHRNNNNHHHHQPSTPNRVNHHNHGNNQHHNNNNNGGNNSPLTNLKLNIDPRNVDCLQLCMDVPFVDHPYLIGPRGRKSQYFMTRYKSLLHFPDTNCRADGLKLNNVLISGSMKNVEEIRAQIRLRTPIRVVVQLAQFSNPKLLAANIERSIAERSLPIRFNTTDDFSSGVLKTEWRNEELLIDFCREHMHAKQLKAAREDLFTLAIALLPLINPWNQELSHRLIGSLHEQTGCRIFYPPKDRYQCQPPTYFIKGSSMAGILQAGKYLMVSAFGQGLTMMQITFYMPPGVVPTIQQLQLDDWQRDFLVHTTIYNPEPQPVGAVGMPQFKVVLRSFEFCINGMYFVRSALLGFKKSVQTISYDFMKMTRFLVPYTVFLEAKLYYPLYSMDDKNLNWASGVFYDHFYGGPYSTAPPLIKVATTDQMAAPLPYTPPYHPIAAANQQQQPLSIANTNYGSIGYNGAGADESELEHTNTSSIDLLMTPPNAPQAAHSSQSKQLMPHNQNQQQQHQPYTAADFHIVHLSQMMHNNQSPPQHPMAMFESPQQQQQHGNNSHHHNSQQQQQPYAAIFFHSPSSSFTNSNTSGSSSSFHGGSPADPLMLLNC